MIIINSPEDFLVLIDIANEISENERCSNTEAIHRAIRLAPLLALDVENDARWALKREPVPIEPHVSFSIPPFPAPATGATMTPDAPALAA